MNHEGLWEDHLWKELLFWISDLGREAATKLNINFGAIPRWPNLIHFKAVMSVDFNDGSFHEDISKLVLFTAQDVLLESKSKIGYRLLSCIRYYLKLNIYASFKVHTEETIVAGRATLVKFLELMDEYITQSQPEMNKNLNFPKKHMITHIFDNILAKARMHTELNELNDYVRKATNDPETNEPLDIKLAADPVIYAHLSSKQSQHSFSNIACTHKTDRAFNDFWVKLNGFLNVFLPQNDIPLPDGKALHLRAKDEITEFLFLWTNYKSMPLYILMMLVSVFIEGRMLIWDCGAALTKDPETNGDYFIMHTMDMDMFLHVKSLQATAQKVRYLYLNMWLQW
ncbi:hypothetical protein EV424DRAFT_1351698 [Suillus variegatus]|nr:hypothetical protein EV424DRAFT_1351698 [Suillus variegatus]